MDDLDDIARQISDKKAKKPPLHLWSPALSGDIDIVIRANGDWFHNGGLIKRKPLVKLFASILRKEQDDHYYLVTPVEKWRITVEDAALMIVDMDVIKAGQASQQIVFRSNVDDHYLLSDQYPLTITTNSQTGEPNPKLQLDNGLTGRLTRAVFYRLVELATTEPQGYCVLSEGRLFEMESR